MSIDSPIRISLEQDGDYAFRVQFHDTDLLPLLTDESPPLGQDLGPNPSRMLLAAVANCLVASLLFALRTQLNAPAPLRAEVTPVPQRTAQGRCQLTNTACTLHPHGPDTHIHDLHRVLAHFVAIPTKH